MILRRRDVGSRLLEAAEEIARDDNLLLRKRLPMQPTGLLARDPTAG